MHALIKPEEEGRLRLSDFKKNRKAASIFFSVLLSLTKFIAYEQRDPFASRQEQIDNPDLSEWDRFCDFEYLRLADEEKQQNVISS